MTANMIYIVALSVGFKCPHKIHLNTQWGGGPLSPTALYDMASPGWINGFILQAKTGLHFLDFTSAGPVRSYVTDNTIINCGCCSKCTAISLYDFGPKTLK